MRAGLLLTLVMAGCAAQASGSAEPAPGALGTTVADQTWTGLLNCDAMPPSTTKPLHQPITLEVRNGTASFGRDVLKPDSRITSGFQERTSGRVSADGAVSLTGQGLSERSGYSAEYQGTLPPSGERAELTGRQHWLLPRSGPVDRNCTVTLRRAS